MQPIADLLKKLLSTPGRYRDHRYEQQRFARMFAESPFCMCILKGPHHVFEEANENYCMLAGRKNVKGKTVRELFPELSNQDFFHWLDQVYQTGKTYSGHETPLTIDREGNGKLSTHYINFIYQPYLDNEGNVEGIFFFGTDVTEQVNMRKQIEQNEKRIRALIESSHDILVLFDETGTRKYVSPAFERTLGFHLSEIIGERVFDQVHPEDAGKLYTVVTNAFELPGEPIEVCARFRKTDGTYVWLEGFITNMLQVEGVNALVVNFRNIDDRKKAEEELELFFRLSGDLLCIAGTDGYYKKVNPAFTKAMGYSEKELLTTSYLNLIHPDDLERSLEAIKTLGVGKELFNFENRGITKDAKVRHFVWTATPINNNLLFALAKDITDIRNAEKEAEKYSKRITLILESITDAFFTIDTHYTVTYWNQQAEKIMGVDRNTIVGKNLWDVFPKAKELQFYPEYEKALHQNISVRFEEYNATKNMWFEICAYPMDEGLSIYFRDITEAKKNYQNLVKTETDVRNFARQLNTMLEEERSRIAREIHDEFGQQLAGIKMSMASFKRLTNGNEQMKSKLDEIVLDIENTMHSLRSFATELRPGILDTMGLLPSLEWLAKEFGKKTGIKCHLDFDIYEHEIEKTFSTCYFRICQEALTNILKHAQASNVVIQAYKENNELLLHILDDGIGIVEEKILNPFSMGILGMKERANLIGGTLQIRRGVFGGTLVQLKAKIHAA